MERVTEREVQAAAVAAMRRHGQGAEDHARKMVGTYEQLGNQMGAETWRRILVAVQDRRREEDDARKVAAEAEGKAEPKRLALTADGFVKWWGKGKR